MRPLRRQREGPPLLCCRKTELLVIDTHRGVRQAGIDICCLQIRIRFQDLCWASMVRELSQHVRHSDAQPANARLARHDSRINGDAFQVHVPTLYRLAAALQWDHATRLSWSQRLGLKAGLFPSLRSRKPSNGAESSRIARAVRAITTPGEPALEPRSAFPVNALLHSQPEPRTLVTCSDCRSSRRTNVPSKRASTVPNFAALRALSPTQKQAKRSRLGAR